MEEKVLYQGGPSQLLNLSTYIMCLGMVIAFFIAPVLWDKVFMHSLAKYKNIYFGAAKLLLIIAVYLALKAWLTVKSHKYKISTERFSETEGIFSRTTHDLELFRVRDITFSEPFSLRLVGCGDIILNTNDKTTPIVVLHGVKDAKPVVEILRKNVDIMRTRKGVREIEGSY